MTPKLRGVYITYSRRADPSHGTTILGFPQDLFHWVPQELSSTPVSSLNFLYEEYSKAVLSWSDSSVRVDIGHTSSYPANLLFYFNLPICTASYILGLASSLGKNQSLYSMHCPCTTYFLPHFMFQASLIHYYLVHCVLVLGVPPYLS